MITRRIFTLRRRAVREAIFNTLGGLALLCGALTLMLAYFDVLVK
jgi:hypothetical protein